MERKNIGIEAALQKIRQYCAYQERNHREVKEKLYSFGLYKHDVEELISRMIEENYLNEERYALMYAGGKFRVKNWGKVKIRYELKLKGISNYCIEKALAAIDDSDYEATLDKLFSEKLLSLKKEKNIFTRKRKIRDFLLQKGFENGLIAGLIHKI
ncbi:MAG: RecX family transcriptional regulator [Bacteroidetes bacterium]|nr:RecX family transcriptional regulator [Bacteroidota bacterium]